MKIGLVGYFNFGNYGDELFLDVFKNLFAEDTLTVLSDRPTTEGFSSAAIETQDCVIIGGGDLVIPYAFAAPYWDNQLLKKPVFIVGVGVPKWGGRSEEAVTKMQKFFQHDNVRLITARDQQSADWIRSELKPKAPVHFYPDLVTALDFERKTGHMKSLGLVLRGHQKIDYDNIELLLERAVNYGYSIKNIVLATGPSAADDRELVERLDFPFTELIIRDSIEDLTEVLAECDVVVSQKFHGCVVAMMMGIPCISLSHSDKFGSFFEFFGKELFLSQADDPKLKFKLIEPMYRIDSREISRIKAHAREGLLHVRRAVAKIV